MRRGPPASSETQEAELGRRGTRSRRLGERRVAVPHRPHGVLLRTSSPVAS